MKYIILALLISSNAYADTAVWTGNFFYIEDQGDGKNINCEYKVNDDIGYIRQVGYCQETLNLKKK